MDEQRSIYLHYVLYIIIFPSLGGVVIGLECIDLWTRCFSILLCFVCYLRSLSLIRTLQPVCDLYVWLTGIPKRPVGVLFWKKTRGTDCSRGPRGGGG